MSYRISILAIALVLAIASGAAHAADEAKYPNLKGQWMRFGGAPRDFGGLPGQLSFDQTKPWGLGAASSPDPGISEGPG